MKVLVLGAGVVGVTSAWYLARAGHEVTVIDRQPGPGLETSFANGGQISASHIEPWANPGAPALALKWMRREDAPLIFRWKRWDPALWMWGLRFLRNCTPGRARLNAERTLRVNLYSRRALAELRSETGIEYDQRLSGILHIWRDAAEFARVTALAEDLERMGLRHEVKTPGGCVAVEPALANIHNQLVGGIYNAEDESGDAHQFTIGLARMAQAEGVTFHYGRAIQGFPTEAGRITGVATAQGTLTADAYVVSLGSFSPIIARGAGLRLPVYPAKGYSLTVPIDGFDGAPQVSITDDENKMVYTRLGERLRIAGTAELGGYDASLDERRVTLMLEKARALFPAGGDYDQTVTWAGLRPVTPDSVPIIGPTPVPNLWLNTGHGMLGWTMACGSARLLADMITGRQPEIDPSGLGLDRF